MYKIHVCISYCRIAELIALCMTVLMCCCIQLVVEYKGGTFDRYTMRAFMVVKREYTVIDAPLNRCSLMREIATIIVCSFVMICIHVILNHWKCAFVLSPCFHLYPNRWPDDIRHIVNVPGTLQTKSYHKSHLPRM